MCGKLTSRMPSASMMMVQVPLFSTKGSTNLFWGMLTKAGSELGANTISLDCSRPAGVEEETEGLDWIQIWCLV